MPKFHFTFDESSRWLDFFEAHDIGVPTWSYYDDRGHVYPRKLGLVRCVIPERCPAYTPDDVMRGLVAILPDEVTERVLVDYKRREVCVNTSLTGQEELDNWGCDIFAALMALLDEQEASAVKYRG